MRSLALLLLLANISFLSWQLNQFPWLPWQPEHVTQSNSNLIGKSTISNLPQLVLLKEHQEFQLNSQFPPQQPNRQANLAVVKSSANNLQKNSTLTKVVTNLAGNTTQEVEETPNTSDDDVSKKPQLITKSLNQLATNPTGNDRVIGVEIAQQPHVKNLTARAATTSSDASPLQPAVKLSAEQKQSKIEDSLPSQPVKKVTNTTNQAKPLTATMEQAVICLESGPYTQIATVQPLYNWLKNKLWLKNKSAIKRDFQVEIQPRQTQVLESTWVYLPPFKNRQAAYAAQQRLNQLGIVDYMIVTQGHFNNAISLGRYRNPNNVQQRLKELSTKGYQNIKTQERYRNDTHYWLNVKILPKASHALLNAFEKRFKKKTLKPINCESIAKAG